RARRIDRRLPACPGVVVDRRRDTVSGQDENRPGRSLGLVLDEDRAAHFEIAHHVSVVDDQLADVDRSPIEGERTLHRLDGALYSRAITPGRRKQDPLNQTASHGSNGPLRPPRQQLDGGEALPLGGGSVCARTGRSPSLGGVGGDGQDVVRPSQAEAWHGIEWTEEALRS